MREPARRQCPPRTIGKGGRFRGRCVGAGRRAVRTESLGVLLGISCPRPASCVAVGFLLGPGPGHVRPLAEASNGATWPAPATAPLAPGFLSEPRDSPPAVHP